MAPHTKTIFDSNMQKIYLINAGCQGLPAPIQHPLSLTICDSVMLCYKMAVPYCDIPVGLQIRMMLCVLFLSRFEIWNGCCRIFACTEHCMLEHRSRYSPRLVRKLLVSYLTYILFLLLTMSTTTVSLNKEKYLKISDLNFC